MERVEQSQQRGQRRLDVRRGADVAAQDAVGHQGIQHLAQFGWLYLRALSH
jgi:hypothetical protein